MSYQEFITKKTTNNIQTTDIKAINNDMLFDFQKHIVDISLKRARSAIFADCGLGKTIMQLVWANSIFAIFPNANILIIAPLSVNQQTILEGEKYGITVRDCRSDWNMNAPGIWITNYESLHKCDISRINAVVLDESSILKSVDGKTKRLLVDCFKTIPYKLCCTATPSPNDLIEIINHAEFLGIMTEKEIKAKYFIQDGNSTQKWRLKKHGVNGFWEWVGSWSIGCRFPSDLGFSDNGYNLCELKINVVKVKVDLSNDGFLFNDVSLSLTERRAVRKNTVNKRVDKCVELIQSNPDKSWVVWCDLNVESNSLAKNIGGSVEIIGSDSLEKKEKSINAFGDGSSKYLVTKPSIAGFGLNWQHCHNMIFCGLSDSYEQFYQAIRRCYRFGQTKDVNVYIVISDQEEIILQNIISKQKKLDSMFANVIKHFNQSNLNKKVERNNMEIKNRIETSEKWTLIQGDSVAEIKNIESESVGLTIFSPPFPSMYVYSNSPNDIGNSGSIDELLNHLEFMIPDLNRILMPGRNCCIHLTQTPIFKKDAGYVGLADFRGKLIELMVKHDFIYYSEVTIDKDPQIKALRTKDNTLTMTSLARDSAIIRPCMADYLLIFKKKGDNVKPIKSGNTRDHKNENGWISDQEWIKWARPVWGDIRETDTLNVKMAKDENDEKHLCPLQLPVIERSVKLWTNPGEVVFSPFAGIGSEGYESIRWNRRFVGIELKESYFNQAVINLKNAENCNLQIELPGIA